MNTFINNRIENEHVSGICRFLETLPGGFTAKRGKLNNNEIIIGQKSAVKGAITIKLSQDAEKRPAWYVGNFPNVTPKEISEEYEVGAPISLKSAYHWGDMLKLVKEIVA